MKKDINPLFTGTIIKTTSKAVFMKINKKEIWLPRSLCIFSKPTNWNTEVQVSIPIWIAEQNNILIKNI